MEGKNPKETNSQTVEGMSAEGGQGSRELVCICCPLGCMLTAVAEENGEVKVSGNTCRRGEEYGKKELTNPTRIVTTTVKVKNGTLPVASVKTKEGIPKGKIGDCIRCLQEVEMEAPIHIGDLVLEDAAGTGTDIIATKEVDRRS